MRVGGIIAGVVALILGCTGVTQALTTQQQESKPQPAVTIVQQAQEWQTDACQQMHDTLINFYGMTDAETTQQTREAGCEK